MGRRIDWVKIGEMVQKINEHNLSYREGARRFYMHYRTMFLILGNIQALVLINMILLSMFKPGNKNRKVT